jgi:hypothetical protein
VRRWEKAEVEKENRKTRERGKCRELRKKMEAGRL